MNCSVQNSDATLLNVLLFYSTIDYFNTIQIHIGSRKYIDTKTFVQPWLLHVFKCRHKTKTKIK